MHFSLVICAVNVNKIKNLSHEYKQATADEKVLKKKKKHLQLRKTLCSSIFTYYFDLFFTFCNLRFWAI